MILREITAIWHELYTLRVRKATFFYGKQLVPIFTAVFCA